MNKIKNSFYKPAMFGALVSFSIYFILDLIKVNIPELIVPYRLTLPIMIIGFSCLFVYLLLAGNQKRIDRKNKFFNFSVVILVGLCITAKAIYISKIQFGVLIIILPLAVYLASKHFFSISYNNLKSYD